VVHRWAWGVLPAGAACPGRPGASRLCCGTTAACETSCWVLDVMLLDLENSCHCFTGGLDERGRQGPKSRRISAGL